MRILLADDDAVSRKLAAAILRDMGHDPEEAQDGSRAWELFQRDDFEAVISDWVMPEADGLELCRRVRAARTAKYPYFILLTGTNCRHEDYLSAMGVGADDFMTKPLDRELLAVRLSVAQRLSSLSYRVHQLETLIPVCAYCRRVRRDDNAYQQMEAYITEHSGTRFSHGICPDCVKLHFPDYADKAAGHKRAF